ncbi:MAG: hypothetical protein J6P02_05260 [Lachnospiraceae bacterium]|nr:hypothetical protein [Lachnospiraceae bacterium]
MKKGLIKIRNLIFGICIFIISIFTNFIYVVCDLICKILLSVGKFCKKYQGKIWKALKIFLFALLFLSFVMTFLLWYYLKNADLINPKLIEFANSIKDINSVDIIFKVSRKLVPIISSLIIGIIGGLIVDRGSKKRTNDYQRKRLLTSLSELNHIIFYYPNLLDFKSVNDYEILLEKVNQIMEDGKFVFSDKEFYIINYMQKAVKNMFDLKLKIVDKEDITLSLQVYIDLESYLSDNKECRAKLQYDSKTFSVDGHSIFYTNKELYDKYNDVQIANCIIRYLIIFYIYKEVLLPKFHKVFDNNIYSNYINPYYVRCET